MRKWARLQLLEGRAQHIGVEPGPPLGGVVRVEVDERVGGGWSWSFDRNALKFEWVGFAAAGQVFPMCAGFEARAGDWVSKWVELILDVEPGC